MKGFVQAAAVVACVLFASGSSMAVSRQPVAATTVMSLNDYAGKYGAWVVSQMDLLSALKAEVIKPRLNVHVPQLIVFNAQGQIIYYGTDVQENANVLASLPQQPRRNDVPEHALTRDGMFAMVPAFAKLKDPVVSNALYLVYSVVPAGDHGGIGTQAAATRALRERLSAAHVNILEVEILTK
ncbi:MAG TPA: hypothetical protein VME23_15225 [Terracidiphilus sp.]|nr:hypothetical protein [Terracidiphilus sp.]